MNEKAVNALILSYIEEIVKGVQDTNNVDLSYKYTVRRGSEYVFSFHVADQGYLVFRLSVHDDDYAMVGIVGVVKELETSQWFLNCIEGIKKGIKKLKALKEGGV